MSPQIKPQHRFIRKFTLALIKSAKQKAFSKKQRDLINTSLIPKFHQRTKELHEEQEAEKSSDEKLEQKKNFNEAPIKNEKQIYSKPLKENQEPKQDLEQLIKPIAKPYIKYKKFPKPKQIQYRLPATHSQKNEEYGKISMLLQDPSVSTIECNGAGTPVSVIRAGQRQITNITLSPKEINEILETIADKAKVPLLEGVFKAAVDNFIISAIHSGSINSRFIIKKSTPYSLLENAKQNH